jgi:hypothetical protein
VKAGDITEDALRVLYAYRGKGGKTGRRELPLPTCECIRAWPTSAGRATLRQ